MNDSGERHSAFHPQKWLWFLILSALAVLGNYLALPVGFNVQFIFGSVFGLTAVVLLGPVAGVIASLIGASYSFVLWNHPYAILIFGCEAAWVALARRKKPNAPIIIADAAFWTLIGVPLVFLFYSGVMHMGLRSTGIVAMKQSLNGISNAILASVLLNYLSATKWLRDDEPQMRRNAQVFFESMAFLLLIPCIGGLMFVNQREIDSSQETLSVNIHRVGHEVEWILTGWMEEHLRATTLLAAIGQEAGFERSDALQENVARVHQLFPVFHNVFVADQNATTLAFDPPANERREPTIGLNFSDREWFQRLKETKKPVVSDVFRARGGVFVPIVSISSPSIIEGEMAGFGLGALNLDRMRSQLVNIAETSELTITVLDRRGAVVVSTNEERRPIETYDIEPTPGHREFVNGVFLSLPVAQQNMSLMRAWQNAVYFSKTPLKDTGWTLVVEGALRPMQQRVYESTIMNMAAIFVLLVATGGASFWISGRLSRPLGELATISADLPDRIESGDEVDWPSSQTTEVALLTSNFKATAEALRQKIFKLKNHNLELESVVAERTAELGNFAMEASQAKAILQSIFDSAPMAIGWRDERSNTAYLNERFVRDIGHELGDEPAVERWIEKAFPDPTYREEIVDRWRAMENATLASGGTSFGPLESWIQCKDGVRRCFDIYGSVLPDTHLAIFADITDRKISEERLDGYARSQEILVQEVNHRVKNNLALLVGMLHIEARRLRDGDPCRTVVDDIEGRVRALSSVHSMLSSNEWRPIQLRRLCEQIITGTLPKDRNPRVEISQCGITVAASQAHNIALVLNELSTNTAKYGSGHDDIHVTVDLSASERMVRITYRDRGPGYPPELCNGDPGASGIGIQLIRGIVEGSLYGTVTFSNQEGAMADIRFERDDGVED